MGPDFLIFIPDEVSWENWNLVPATATKKRAPEYFPGLLGVFKRRFYRSKCFLALEASDIGSF